MIVAIDYDGTWTRDPGFWSGVVFLCRQRGHRPIMVTMRSEEEGVDRYCKDTMVEVFFTDRKQKRPFMGELGIRVDVWIDDFPEFVP